MTTYEDPSTFNKAIDSTESLRSKFINLQNNSSEVIEYWKDIIDLANLTRREKAFLIAGTMFYEVVDKNHNLLELALDAGELELPDEHIYGDPEKRWEKLARDIKQLQRSKS